MTHVNPSLSQAGFRGYADDGGEGSATPKAAENTDWTQAVDENFRVRFVVDETAGGTENNITLQLQYNLNGAGFVNVSGSSSVVRAVASTHVAEEGATTRQLTSGTGTFVTGAFDEADGVAGSGNQIDFVVGGELTEVEYVLQILSADVADSDTIDLRVIRSTGTALEAYDQTPTITVSETVTGRTADASLGSPMAALAAAATAAVLATASLAAPMAGLASTVETSLVWEFSEDFEGSGYENTWSGDVNLDPDFPVSSVTGAGSKWGTDCAEVVRPDAGTGVNSDHTLAASLPVVYWRHETVMNSQSIPANTDDSIFFALRSGGTAVLRLRWRGLASGYGVRAEVATSTPGTFPATHDSPAVSDDTNVRLEVLWDTVNDVYDVRLNGTSFGSGALSGTSAASSIDVLRIGSAATGTAQTFYMDRLGVASNRWIGDEDPPSNERIANAALDAPAATLAASATVSGPVATAALTAPAGVLSATVSVPVSAAASIDAPAATLSASAAALVRADASLSAPAGTLAASASVPVSASASLSAPAGTLSAAATVPANAAASLDAPAGLLSASVTVPANAAAALSAPMATLAAEATGQVSRTADAALSAPSAVLSASASALVAASASLDVPIATLSASATVPVNAAASLTAPAALLSASAAGPGATADADLAAPFAALASTTSVAVSASADLSAPAGTILAAASVPVGADADLAAPAGVLAAAASVPVNASASLAAPTAVLSATAAGVVERVASAALAAPPAALAASATVSVEAAASLSAPAASLAASASVPANAAASLAAPTAALSAAASADVFAAANLSAPAATLSATASATEFRVVDAALLAPAAALAASAEVLSRANASITAPTASLSASGVVDVVGSATLEAPAGLLAASASVPVNASAALDAPFATLAAQANFPKAPDAVDRDVATIGYEAESGSVSYLGDAATVAYPVDD